jgi:hypothetical protein
VNYLWNIKKDRNAYFWIILTEYSIKIPIWLALKHIVNIILVQITVRHGMKWGHTHVCMSHESIKWHNYTITNCNGDSTQVMAYHMFWKAKRLWEFQQPRGERGYREPLKWEITPHIFMNSQFTDSTAYIYEFTIHW